MNRVEIATEGPVMENLCRITVSDQYASGDFMLDNADVERAKSEGQDAVLGLICANMDGDCHDILEAADLNGTDVLLDGENVDRAVFLEAMKGGAAEPTA